MPEQTLWGFFLTTEGVPHPMLTADGDVQVSAVGPGVPDEARTTPSSRPSRAGSPSPATRPVRA